MSHRAQINQPEVVVSRRDEAFTSGLKAQQAGRPADALSFYDRALSLDPDMTAALVNKGAALRSLGRPGEALACYWRALATDPRETGARINAANALTDLDRLEEAAAVLRPALKDRPDRTEIWAALASVLLKGGKEAAAECCLRIAAAHSPGDPETGRRLDALEEKRLASAARALPAVADRSIPEPADVQAFLMGSDGGDRDLPDPGPDAGDGAKSLFQRGLAAQQEGRDAEAAVLYGQAAGLDCDIPGLLNNIGVLLRARGALDAAEACYRRALTRTPDDVSILANYGNVLRELGRYGDARVLQDRALTLRPGDAPLLYNAGVRERDRGDPVRAITLFDRALRIDPDNADYRWDRALALLQAGDYRQGFAAYESRHDLDRAHKRTIGLPLWDGAPLDGRSIFLSDEQGFGDVLQFARFIAGVRQRGAGRIVVECQPPLLRLIGLMGTVDAVVARGTAVPVCDCHCPLLSLPRIFGTTLDTLPATVPYLQAPGDAIRLPDDGRRKLGLVWAGKPTPRDRSCPLDLILPRLGMPGTTLYSLQLGPRAADLGRLGADNFVTDLAPALHDFAETAAVLNQLDLLITVDTAVAHLAGALGVPTFLLLHHVSDWRWFDREDRSPWYPTLRLFRQPAPGQWIPALDRMEQALSRQPGGCPGTSFRRLVIT